MSRTALVLCGGRGTRFRNVSTNPKILAPFRNGKFIDWVISFLNKNGFEKIILSLGYKSEEIIAYTSIHFKSYNLDYFIEDTPLGTGGAVINAFKTFKGEELCVFNGDTFWSNNLSKEFLQKPINIGLCLTKNLPENDRYGDFNIKNKRIIIKKGSSEKILYNSNVFIGIARISRNISTEGLSNPYSFEDLLLSQKHGIAVSKFEGQMFDFGTPEAYRAFGAIHGI